MNHDPFGRTAMPPGFTREDRIRLLAEVADALLSRKPPTVAAAMFVGGALKAWLEAGGGIGTLERDFLRVTPPKGSRRTPAEVLRRAHANEGAVEEDAARSGIDDDERTDEGHLNEHADDQA